MRPRRAPAVRELATALAVCTGLALALLAPALVGRSFPAPQGVWDYDPLYRTQGDVPVPSAGGDFTLPLVDLPRDFAVAGALHAGHWALWNPLSAAGAPLWAEQGGPFFPLRLPFYLAPSTTTYVLFLCLRLIAAGLGAWALAHVRGLSPVAALGAGITFELSGGMIEAVPFGAASAYCMLPWVVLGAEAVGRAPGGRAAAGAAVTIGLAASGGHPTVGAVVLAAYVAALGGHLVARWRDPWAALAIAAWGGVALPLGLVLAAPTVLPLAQLVTESSSYKRRAFGAFNWETTVAHSRATLPLALLAPHTLQRMYLAAGLGPLFEGFATLGVGGLVLGLAGLLGGGLSLPLGSVAVLGLVLALAPPGLGWITEVLGLRALSAYYAWPLVLLPLTQAVGTGIERLRYRGGRRAALGALAVVGTAVALLAFSGAPSLAIGHTTLRAMFSAALASPGGWTRLLLPLSAVALLVVIAVRRRASGWLVAALASELLVLWWAPLQRPRSEVPWSPPSPAVAMLQQRLADGDGRMIGVPFWTGFPLTPMFFGLPDLRGHSALPIERFVDYMQLIDPQGSLITVQMTWNGRGPLLDLAAVRYVAVARDSGEPAPPFLAGDEAMPLIHAGAAVSIYENRAAVPRVRIAHHSEPVADAAAARARLRALSAGKAHADAALIDTVRLESGGGVATEPAAGKASAPEWARIVDASDPDALLIEVELGAPGWVVIADTYYPGWSATVDGEPAPIFPADLLFRAVAVPAGRHSVALRYAPASFRWGVGLFAVGALACVALIVGSRRHGN